VNRFNETGITSAAHSPVANKKYLTGDLFSHSSDGLTLSVASRQNGKQHPETLKSILLTTL
jgi:hypothetical protein